MFEDWLSVQPRPLKPQCNRQHVVSSWMFGAARSAGPSVASIEHTARPTDIAISDGTLYRSDSALATALVAKTNLLILLLLGGHRNFD